MRLHPLLVQPGLVGIDHPQRNPLHPVVHPDATRYEQVSYQDAISQQLKMLRLGGVVSKRRNGKQILYSIADEKVAHLIEFLQAEFLENELVS